MKANIYTTICENFKAIHFDTVGELLSKHEDKAGQWLVPFKGRNYSGGFDQNFLWRSGNIYVMDNHRAALWCWLRHIAPEKPHALFHIDRHYDTLTVAMEDWLENLPPDWRNLSIESYLRHSYEHDIGSIELFRFDNYLSIYFDQFGTNLRAVLPATHQDGDPPNLTAGSYEQLDLWKLPENLDCWIDPIAKPWIVNIDLDYFFCDARAAEERQPLVSREYIEAIFSAVRERLDDGTIAVLTIALSPETCGGWGPSEQALEVAMSALGTKFQLPSRS